MLISINRTHPCTACCLQWWSGATDMGREGAWYWAHSLTPVSCDWSAGPVLSTDWSRCRPGCGAPWRASSSRTAAPRRTTPASRTRRTTSSSTPTPPTMPSTRCVNVIKVLHVRLFGHRKIKSTGMQKQWQGARGGVKPIPPFLDAIASLQSSMSVCPSVSR